MQKIRLQCIYDIHVTEPKTGEKDSLNAYADGKKIVLTGSMVRFASGDAELAFIMAHEYAHNFMSPPKRRQEKHHDGRIAWRCRRHRLCQRWIQLRRDASAQMGMQGGRLAYSPAFEHEADYVALYLLARSGYDYHSAPNFWRRMSIQNPKIHLSANHPPKQR